MSKWLSCRGQWQRAARQVGPPLGNRIGLVGQGFPFGPALLQRARAISCLNILHYLSSHLLPLCCDTYLKYQSLWEPQWDIWKLRNAGFMCQRCVPSLCPFSLHSSMQVVLDEKGIKRGKRKKSLGGTSMADMVETEQKLKAMQERTEWDRERIKAH